MPISRAAALAALACAVLLAGCHPGQQPRSERSLVVWEQQDAAVAPFIDELFARFRALPGNQDVTITRVHYHNEDLRQQFQTASIVGDPPDLLMGPSDAAGVFSISGFILPVDGLFDLSRYNDAARGAISLDGKTWGVPISDGNHLLLFFNKRLSPQAPRTTDELMSDCAALKKRGFDYCLASFEAEPFWLVPWLAAYGGWPIDGKRPTLDTPAMRQAIQFWLDLMYKERYAPEECDYNCADGLFKEGKVAFTINGDWTLSIYADKLGKDLGVARLPKVSATGRWPAPMVSGQYFMLSSKLSGPRLELAKKLIEFYTDEPNQIEQAQRLERLPALKAAARSKALADDPLLRASQDALDAGRPMPMAVEMRAIWDTMRQYLAQALARKLTPDEAARRMQREAALNIKEMDE